MACPQHIMKILHFADAHVGVTTNGFPDNDYVNSRVRDYIESLEILVTVAEALQPDLILFAGDMFHTNRPAPIYMAEVAKILRDFSKIAPTVMIPGNHDMVRARAVTAITTYQKLHVPGLHIVESVEPLHLEISGTSVGIGCMPYPYKSSYKDDFVVGVTAELHKLLADCQDADYKILLGHFTVEGSIFGVEREMALGFDGSIPVESLQGWDYVALGHIHKFQNLGSSEAPIIYPGAVDRVSFGEEDLDPGAVYVDLSKSPPTIKRISTNARPMQTVTIDIRGDVLRDGYSLAELLHAHDILKDSIVRLIIVADSHESVPMTQLREYLDPRCYYIAQIIKDVPSSKKVRLAGHLEDLTEEQALRAYFQEQNTTDVEVDTLLQLFEDIKNDQKT